MRRRTHFLCLAAIVALTLLWFSPVLAGKSYSTVGGHENAVFPWAATPNGLPDAPQSDQADLNYPLDAELSSAAHAGTIPWWNPESFGGQPLFSDGSSALLYPPKLLLALVVSPTSAHDINSMLDVAFAGIFAYLLLIELGLGPLAALFGAIAWMFGSYTLAWLQLEVVAPVFVWLPAGLVSMRKALSGSIRWVPIAALPIALLFVGAHLLYAIVTVGAIALYGICLAAADILRRWRSGERARSVRGVLARLVGVGALGVLLSAFVLVPTASVLGDVSRSNLSYQTLAASFLLPFSDLRYVFWPPSLPISAVEMNWQMAFSGTATLLLALVGLCARRPGAGLGRGLVVVSILVAVGGPVTYVVFRLVPGMNVFRPYSRVLFLFDLGVVVLGAIGLDALLALLRGERAVLGWGASSHEALPARRVAPPVRVTGTVLLVAVVGLTAWQLGYYGRKINPPFEPSSASYQYPSTALTAALAKGGSGIPGWPVRVLSARNQTTGWDPPMLFSNEPLALGIDSAGGYDSSVPTRTVDLWRVVGGESPATVVGTKLNGAYQPLYFAQNVRYSMLPMLGVDRIALTPGAARAMARKIEALGWKRIYRGKDGTVLAWAGAPVGPHVVFDAVSIPNDLAALEAVAAPSLASEREVVIDAPLPHEAAAPGSARATVLSTARGYNAERVVLHSSAAGWLVVPDMWDAGWHATVNGKPAPVLRGDFNEQVVAIPSGADTVLLSFTPPGLLLGGALSVLGALVAVALLAWPNAQRRIAARRRSATAAAPAQPVLV